MPEPDLPSTPQPYALLGLIRPYGREAVPESFDRGEALFDDAVAAYEQASYPRAMRGFVEAADALVTEPDNTYVAEFAHNRVLAYRNAAWASLMAHQPELGRELLRGAATHDAECAPEIERILDGILSI